MIRYDPVWSGMIRYDPVWSGMIRYDPVWSGMIRYDPVWSGMIRYDPVWSGMIRYDPVWSGMIRYDPVWSVRYKQTWSGWYACPIQALDRILMMHWNIMCSQQKGDMFTALQTRVSAGMLSHRELRLPDDHIYRLSSTTAETCCYCCCIWNLQWRICSENVQSLLRSCALCDWGACY